ncbi:MAG: hypothetical protein M3R04_05515 [bacterium]|nr:hypothetical protein [bacterium]
MEFETPELIRVWADWRSNGVLNEEDAHLDHEDVPVTDSLWNRLQSWTARYQPIVRISDRDQFADVIEQLDIEGLDIAREIQRELGEVYEIRYYSEGNYRYIEL